MSILSSTFVENSAIMGAVLYFEIFPSNFENCSFLNNSASYGITNGSYPYRLRIAETMQHITNGSLKNIPTGVYFPITIEIDICDIFNQKISILNDGFVLVKLVNLNITNQEVLYQNVKGNLDIKISNGSANFDQISLFSNPTNVTLGLAFSSTSINQNFGKVDYNTIKLSSNEYILDASYYFIIPTEIRPCIPGEIYDQSINSCSQCPTNTFSLNIEDLKCTGCYLTADCFGGMNLSLHPGYWRSGLFSPYVHNCQPYPESCLYKNFHENKKINL